MISIEILSDFLKILIEHQEPYTANYWPMFSFDEIERAAKLLGQKYNFEVGPDMSNGLVECYISKGHKADPHWVFQVKREK